MHTNDYLSRRLAPARRILPLLALAPLLLAACRQPAISPASPTGTQPKQAPAAINDQQAPEGASYFVAPGGSPQGDGSLARPWDLQTALDGPTVVRPGDTIWLRGGVYKGTFVSALRGSAPAPVVVRAYPAERAVIDKAEVESDGHPLEVKGSFTWYRDLEITNSNPARSSGGDDILRGNGVTVLGPGNKFINMVVHDTACGFGFWKEAVDSEIYGSIIFNNGWSTPGGGKCHGIYLDNVTGLKVVADNIVFNNFNSGIHAYSETDPISGLRIEGNITAMNGAPGGHLQSNILVGGLFPASDVTLLDNHAYFPENATEGYNLVMGLRAPADTQFIARGNYVSGGFEVLKLEESESFAVTGNSIFGSGPYLALLNERGIVPRDRAWDNNRYFFTGGKDYQFKFKGRDVAFARWQLESGFDRDSSFSTSLPAEPLAIVRPNRYERGRANIVVWNWPGRDTVAADLSGVLSLGDRYEIRNAFDYLSSPLITATFDGSPVMLPMSPARLPVATPTGLSSATPSTAPYFAAFIVSVPPPPGGPPGTRPTPLIPGMPANLCSGGS